MPVLFSCKAGPQAAVGFSDVTITYTNIGDITNIVYRPKIYVCKQAVAWKVYSIQRHLVIMFANLISSISAKYIDKHDG